MLYYILYGIILRCAVLYNITLSCLFQIEVSGDEQVLVAPLKRPWDSTRTGERAPAIPGLSRAPPIPGLERKKPKKDNQREKSEG